MSFKGLTILNGFLIFIFYLGLILSLFYFWDASLFKKTLLSERTLFSIKISLAAATIATLLALLFSIPAAYALSRYDFKGKELIDTILEFPMIVSPAALGATILIFFNNPLGSWIQENVISIVFTFYGIILAQFITVLGIATRMIKSAFDEIPQRYEEVSQTLGVSPFKTFWLVSLPLARRGILASIFLTWAKAMGEFGATITVAGTMAMKTETLPIAIFMRLSGADIEGTVILILLLIFLGLTILYGVRILNKKLWWK